VGGPAEHVTRWRTVAGACVVVVATAVAAWSLAYPQNPLGTSMIRACSDIAAVVTLGLALVPRLDDERFRVELARRAAGPLVLSAGIWTATELVRLFVTATEEAGVPVGALDVRTATEFAVSTSAGRSGLVCLAAAAACVVAAALPGTAATGIAAAGLAALGLLGRTLVGHLSTSGVGGFAIALHSLAAAVWCGGLAALVLTVERRGQWARVLPRFSQLSLACVVVLLVCGIAGAIVKLGSPQALYTTGYGRLLLAKIVVTVALTALAWSNRARWLPAARSHRATAEVSQFRSRIELALMGVALTFAAALAVTG
jgi:copper resistance protein D